MGFWNVPAEAVDASLTAPAFCTAVVSHLLHTESTPFPRLLTLHAFVQARPFMRASGFEGLINPDLIKALRLRLILDRQSPLKERIESITYAATENPRCLADIMERYGAAAGGAGSAGSSSTDVGDFSVYVAHLQVFLAPGGLPYWDAYQHKRFFIDFKEKHPDIELPSSLTNLPKIFNPYGRDDLTKPYVHLNSTWSMSLTPQVDPEAGMIFGVTQQREGGLLFDACEGSSGYAVWSMGFPGVLRGEYGIAGQDFFYRLTADRVYFVVNNTIKVLDKKRGNMLSSLSLNDAGKIKQLHDNGMGTIFIGIEYDDKKSPSNKVVQLDATTFAEKGFAISFAEKGRPFVLEAGPYVLGTSYGSVDLSIIAADGTVKLVKQITPDVPEDSDVHFLFAPRLASSGAHLFYQEWGVADLRRMVKYNMETGVRVEAIDLPYPMRSSPKITPDGQTLVYLSEKHLVALHTNPLRLLWQKDVSNPGSYFGKINQFKISPDGKVIYGIEGDLLKSLFAYDVATGAERDLGAIEKQGRSHKLIGVLPGADGTNKVIIAPYSY